MSKDNYWPETLQAKAVDDRDKLLHNNKDVVDQESLKLWEAGKLQTHEFIYKIDSSVVRETFMYLTIVIYEMEEHIAKIKSSKIKETPEYHYSC